MAIAQYRLGRAYYNGDGLPKDLIESFARGCLASRYNKQTAELIADLHMDLNPKNHKKAKARAEKLKQ